MVLQIRHGLITLNLNLTLRRDAVCRFIISDVAKSISRLDFLACHDLLVDV